MHGRGERQLPGGSCRAAATGMAVLLLLLAFCGQASAVRLALQPGDDRMAALAPVLQDSSKLARIARNSRFAGAPADLVAKLQRNSDLEIDEANEALVYACKGLQVHPGTPWAARAAQAAEAAAAYDAAIAMGAVPDPAVVATFLGYTEPLAMDAVATAAEPVEAAAAYAVTEGVVLEAAAAQPVTEGVALEAAAAQPVAEGVALEAAAVDGGNHHHHRHHRRQLLATLTDEHPSPWLPDMPARALNLTETFTLHSRPNSVKKIYLDFNGHTATGTAWNANKGITSIVTPVFSTDSDPSYSASELAIIFTVWRMVSEDYSVFDVDVTTEAPSESVLARNGIRVAIGGSSSWYGSAGGVAYLDSFGYVNSAGVAYYSPAYVFPQQLGPNSAKYMAEATSHEVGHTLGLDHDGLGSSEYYNGVAGWGPIMGAPYDSAVTQWSKGEYSSATNTEDDFSMITYYLPYATDVYGSTTATATAMVPDINASGVGTAKVAGIIRGPSDVDVLSFLAQPGTATVQVLVSPTYSNLNVRLDLLNAAGTVLATRSGVGISAFTYAISTAGTYYLSLSPVGSGSASTPPGYSTYGSRGQYQVVMTYAAGIPVVCSTAPQDPVNGAFLSCSTTSLGGSTCTATCSNGYGPSAAGAPTVTCTAVEGTGVWSAAVGECVPVCLGQPTASPTNGAFNCPANSLPGYTCSATCNTGYAGPVTSTCSNEAVWGTVEGTCKRVCSTAPTAPANGAYPTGSCPAGSLEGKTCVATCSSTFSASKTLGSPTTTCQSTGTWSAITGSCLKVCSTRPSNPTNAVYGCPALALAGDQCVGQCVLGYAPGSTGAPSQSCLSTGSWSSVTGSCVRVCNTAPTNPLNGAFDCSPTSLVNSQCVAKCSEGYAGSPTVTCGSTGTWSAVTGSCSRVCSVAPSNPDNGAFSCSTSSLAGSTCTGQCNTNFTGTPRVTCQSEGTWSQLSGGCTRVCPVAPASPTNGVFECPLANSTVGAVCTAKCSTGYAGNPVPQAACQEDSTWSVADGGQCSRACSTNPTQPSNGVYSCIPTLTGSTCTAKCNTGYGPSATGAPRATCSATATWSATTGSCVRVCSTSATNPANGAFPSSCIGSLPTTVCTATCNPGSGPGSTGAPRTTCGSTGSWGTVSGTCVKLCSTAPTNPANGVFSCSPTSIPATVCRATCNSGYTGTPQVTCQTTGLWGALSGSCAPGCTTQPLFTGANAAFACAPTAVNSKCTATCARGFIAGSSGAPASTCTASNTWSTPVGSCVAVVCSSAPRNGTPSGASYSSLCAGTLNGNKCTATCTRATATPPVATCTLPTAGTTASWTYAGACP